MPIASQPWRFFDPVRGFPDESDPPTGTTARVRLERVIGANRLERFRLRRTLGYVDRSTGRAIVAPPDLELGGEDGDSQIDSDLTSVPDLFTWLVPKTGAHLPAAIIHDSMIGEPEYVVLGAADGVSDGGFVPVTLVWPADGVPAPFDAVDADRIFRDAMADAGTGVIRRWLIWTAVTLRTIFALDGTSDRKAIRWYYASVAALTLLTIGWLGYQATAQIFGWTDVWPWRCTYELPWIRSELPGSLDGIPKIGTGLGARLTSGAVFAVVLPIPAGFLWGKFARAGIIAGIAFAALFHVTIALFVLSALYMFAEALVTPGRSIRDLLPRTTRTWGIVGAAAAIVAVVAAICLFAG